MFKFGLMVFWLGVLSVLDFRQKKVPVWLLSAGGILGAAAAVYAYCDGTNSVVEIILGMLPGGLLLLVAAVTKKAGWADGIVLVTMSLLTDFRECVTCFVISLFTMSVVSLLLLTFRKVGKGAKLPYLPFLWAGYLLQAAIGMQEVI